MKITFQLPGAAGSSEGTSAVNLRQSSQAGRKVLTPVGPPAVVAAAESSAAHHLGGDGMLLVGHDGLGLTHLTAAVFLIYTENSLQCHTSEQRHGELGNDKNTFRSSEFIIHRNVIYE